MIRIILAGLLVLCFCVPQSAAAANNEEELLDKAQAALIWFRSLDDEFVQRRTPAETYREFISPLELIQAAALLYSYRTSEHTDLAEQLLEMLPHHQLTPEEMFEIHDILGTAGLRELTEIETPYLGRISTEAVKFRSESLNSAEQVVLHREPTTALELMQAIDVLSVVGRPVFVRHYLRRFLNGEFPATPEQSARIVEILGTQKLLQLAVHPEFAPLSKDAVDRIIAEAKNHWQDEERIAEALQETDWFTDSAQVRREALPDLKILWQGDQLSVQQVFERLATIEDEQEADQLTAILLSVRRDMTEALAAALGAYNGKLRYHAARGLAASVPPQEAFLLYQFVFNDEIDESERETVRNTLEQRRITLPSQERAAAILFERATDYFERRRPVRIDTDGNVSFWGWEKQFRKEAIGDVSFSADEPPFKEGIVYYVEPNIETAYKSFALGYYHQSLGVLPLSSANRKAYVFAHRIALIERTTELSNRGTVHYDLSGAIAPEDAEQFLKLCLEKDCFYAALVAIRVLAEHGDADLVQSTTGKPRILVQATVAKDRAVRFAALNAIMQLNPAEPFAGSSLVADTLVWFARSEGESIVLSGHPQIASAIQAANLFLGLGYRPDVATTCRELFARAAISPDVELVVVDARTPQQPVGEFVQMMFQDARTAEIPIAILTSDQQDLNPNVNAMHRNTMTEFDRRNPHSPFRTSLSLTYPPLATEASARWVRDDLVAKTGVRAISAEKRLEMAKQALRWLCEIKLLELSGGPKIYHFEDFDSVVLDALHSERRVEEGLQLASVIRSARLQAAMSGMSENVMYPDRLRERAREALDESIERFGFMPIFGVPFAR
ncbi:MAG: hypothetical protein FWG73_09610 [Planctomycetaceae bacterium]|nr:hypothetical protein [Planctomycetaceae bacterium]